MTPCERLLKHPDIPGDVKRRLKLQGKSLDPIGLLHRIRDQQSALAALSRCENKMIGLGKVDLKQFMKKLGTMWRYGEVRSTHRTAPKKPRYWRTRKDPFEMVWPEVLLWLQEVPDSTAKELFERLQKKYPGSFLDGQLRTLQRRIRAWRQVMARRLIYANLDAQELPSEVTPIGIDKTHFFR